MKFMSTIIFPGELKFLLNMSERRRKSGKNNHHQNNAQQDILSLSLSHSHSLTTTAIPKWPKKMLNLTSERGRKKDIAR
jgi:hypothetical protein